MGTLAADDEIAQEWYGVDMLASAWCTSEANDIWPYRLVVIYKIDRLSRPLSDFAKMVDLFDAHGVTFVLMTQLAEPDWGKSQPRLHNLKSR